MRHFPVFLALLLAAVGNNPVTMAADTGRHFGPEIIEFKMGELNLPFEHWNHQKLQESKCFYCHSTNSWLIKVWNKEVAHKMCISCHEQNDRGPVACKECHNTSYSSIKQDHP
jgi:hypothetical protein